MIRNALWAALLLSTAHGAEGAEGDFAPLAVGNTWVYSIEESGTGFWWTASVRHQGRRTLRVESSIETPGGGSLHVLSFRDSLYKRERSQSTGISDTLRMGTFQVAQSASDGRLSLLSAGDPIPAGMEVFFRRRFRSGGTAVSTGNGDSLYVVPVSATYNSRLKDSAVYARDLGLLYLHRSYDVWTAGGYTPGLLNTVIRLVAFNGSPVTVSGSFTNVAPGPQLQGFAGLKAGRSWRYRGLRQLVPESRSSTVTPLRRDSVFRALVVTGVTASAGVSDFQVSIEDSLRHRTYGGQPVPDTVVTGTVTVRLHPDSLFLMPIIAVDDRTTYNDIWILFNRHSFLEEAAGARDFGSGPVRVAEYRAGCPGLLEDTLIHAEGIGFIRRSKILQGTDPGLSERLDWRLVELDGQPFEAGTVPILRLQAPHRKQVPSRSKASDGLWFLRNLLGRKQAPTPS